MKQVNAQVTNNAIASHNREKELLGLQKQVSDEQQKFHSALLELKSEIEKWIQQYVLVAPENGKVLFVSSHEKNVLISNGQGMF